jgi:heat shock protein HspQ
MKAATYMLSEEQIEFVDKRAKDNSSSASAALRSILDQAMAKRLVMFKGLNGVVQVDPEFAQTGDSPVSCEQVSTK